MEEKKEEKPKEDTTNDAKVVTLVAAEDKKIQAPYKLLKASNLISSMVHDSGFDEPIPVKFSEKCINLMIEFMKHYEDKTIPEIKRPIREKTLEEYCTWENNKDEWLAKFLKMEVETLCEMIMLTNFVDYPALYDFLCASFAFHQLLNKTSEGIRKDFGVENDFTPDEQKKIDFFFIWNKLIDWTPLEKQAKV